MDRWVLRSRGLRSRRHQCGAPADPLTRKGSLLSPLGPRRTQAEALGAGLDDVGVEGEPVDDGGDEARVTYHLAPLGKWKVRCGGHRGLLLALGQILEQQLCSFGIELDVADGSDLNGVKSSWSHVPVGLRALRALRIVEMPQDATTSAERLCCAGCHRPYCAFRML